MHVVLQDEAVVSLAGAYAIGLLSDGSPDWEGADGDLDNAAAALLRIESDPDLHKLLQDYITARAAKLIANRAEDVRKIAEALIEHRTLTERQVISLLYPPVR
jgi:hypothetical protein